MNKKMLLALLLALALLTLTACGGTDKVETVAPTAEPTAEATAEPTAEPTEEPTEEPTAELTEEPTAKPTAEPTAEPTEAPADEAAEPAALSEEDAPAAEATAGETEAVGEADTDPVLASAYEGEIAVRLSDVQADFDTNLQSYIQYYAQYGYTMDEYDADLQASVAQETVQMALSERIVSRYAAEQGYVLTEEDDEALRAQAEATVDNVREYYETYLAYYGYEGEELAQTVEDELAASGYTVEAIYENLRLQSVIDFLYDLSTTDVTITEEEVRAAFDAKVAEQKETYADVDTFINDTLNGADILSTPEGVRIVQCIFIAKEDEATPDEATADEATADEVTADEAPADEATPGEAVLSPAEIAELSGREKAQAVSAAIESGAMSFAEAMAAFNEDSSTQEQMDAGYPVAEGSALYGDEFKNGAMSLKQPGDVTGVVETDYGFFILSYVRDLQSGEADFEARKETETTEALESAKDAVFSDYINAMIDEANVQILDASPLYHVYVGETIEATVAYASVTEDTDLTDMPNGDAVARLAAGATLDVLGRIGMDGEEYAFVAVPGTAFKGYLNVKQMAEMDETAALAADNTALSEVAIAVDKLPTFTIVMNDGSLIYGELYPDVAPETVGNFISLAGEGFYDGLTFHRVIPGFMIQGGDPNGDGTGGPGYAIRGEFSNNGVQNDLSHTRGVLSMARSSAMDSAGSQFFIMHADNDYLDGDYAAFGMVLGGIETVDLIASVPTDSNDKPRNEQAMRTIYVETYGKTYTFTRLED